MRDDSLVLRPRFLELVFQNWVPTIPKLSTDPSRAFMFHSSPESGGGMVTAEAMIPLKVETGTVYEPTGSVFGKQRADFWIRERGTGTKASKVVSVIPKSFGPYVGPLILPAD